MFVQSSRNRSRFTFPVFGFDGTGAAGGGGGGAGLRPSFGLTFATGCDALSALFLPVWRCLGTQPAINKVPEVRAATNSQVEYPKDRVQVTDLVRWMCMCERERLGGVRLKCSFMMIRY